MQWRRGGRVRRCVALAVAGVAALVQPAQAIVAGAPPDTPAARVDPNTVISPWRGVVSIDRAGSIYSGVLVGRRHVLTAAHVIDAAQPPSTYRVNLNLSAAPLVLGVVKTTTHPGYGGIGVNDVALLQLDQDAPPDALIYPLASANPALGTTLTLVGYGDSGNGSTGLTVGRSATVKRVGANVFDYSPDSLDYYFDFDGPGAATNYLGGTTLGNTTECTLAGGDSGGPAFATMNGARVIVGINAFVATFNGGPATPGTFGTAGGGTFVAPVRSWIDGTLSASGVEGNDIPLPAWALVALAGALVGLPGYRRR